MIKVLGPTPATDEDWRMRVLDTLQAFSPGAPIDELDLLAGRINQIEKMIETVMQRGQHPSGELSSAAGLGTLTIHDINNHAWDGKFPYDPPTRLPSDLVIEMRSS